MICLVALAALSQVHVHWKDDEARAVIAALQDSIVTPGEMDTVVATEGYRRLKEREFGMKRPFTDDDFATFLKSPKATASDYQKTLDNWARLDFNRLGLRAAAHLPAGAKLEASVYPLIKPKTNSFVWDVAKNPAIMLYLDPAKQADEIAMTVTHELHHIGYSSCCPNKSFESWVASQPAGRKQAWMWVGAFGEGYAVLAASIDRKNPIGPSAADVRAAWDDGMTHLDRDFRAVEKFLVDTAAGKLTETEIESKASEFYGIQGPWYTIGYVLATTIEDAFGRPTLLTCYENPRQLFGTYNRALKKLKRKQPLWTDDLMRALGAD